MRFSEREKIAAVGDGSLAPCRPPGPDAPRPRRLPARAAIAAFLALSSSACGTGGADVPAAAPAQGVRPTPGPPPLALVDGVTPSVIDAPGVTGLSDLTVDDEGQLWAVPERNRVLLRMRADGGAPRAIPVEGVPSTLDTEGVTWVGDGRFVLATESKDPRRFSDVLLFARLADGGARIAVERTVVLDYSRWPFRPLGNQGIEGVCHAGRALVAAVESVQESAAGRFAPVAVYDLDGGAWTPYLVRLTSATGKLSAVSCRMRGGAIDVLAVERHFEVAHLIRFALPGPQAAPAPPVSTPAGTEPPPPAEIEPVLVADLASLIQDRENFEGLVWDGDRAITLIVDNDWAGVSGPNLLVRARLTGAVPAPPLPPAPQAPPAQAPASPPARRAR
ncbi:MAG TPA: esterase-like activity of phytase family protein [Kofleriaceae bacterium]|nr:esterase-like activity of phytase family protein [Kofleriaceae bacterium]